MKAFWNLLPGVACYLLIGSGIQHTHTHTHTHTHIHTHLRFNCTHAYFRFNHYIVITSIAITNYIHQVIYILYHRMLKYHTNIYQLENLRDCYSRHS